MSNNLGITRQGLDLALSLREKYLASEPPVILDETHRLLMPEHLLNRDIDLQTYEDPLPLAMVASRDPDSPMSIAAVIRMFSSALSTPLVTEVFSMLGETSKHAVVKQCVEAVTESAFNPEVIKKIRYKATKFVVMSRSRYTEALKNNLKFLMTGQIDASVFVSEFFKLSEAGNLRLDIKKRLILGLLTSDKIRPSIKFLFLENLECLPLEIRRDIINEAINSPDKPNLEVIKQELAWLKLELPSNRAN